MLLQMKQELLDKSNVTWVSLTTDSWTTPQCTESLLSLTAHWIDQNFNRKSAILHTSKIEGQHTATNIGTMCTSMISEWGLQGKVHVILRDNAATMIKALRDENLLSIGCTAHTLQLSINRALKAKRAVEDAVAVCKKIATHFNKSSTAKEKLEKIQADGSIPQHAIIQDVATRWNSTYYMLERIQEQKLALAAYAAQQELTIPTHNQWVLIEKLINILEPFHFVTKELSSDNSTLADVIPTVTAIVMSLADMPDAGVGTVKDELLSDVRSRFEHMESESLYAVATLIDPRYKDRLFQNKEEVTAMLLGEASKFCTGSNNSSTASASMVPAKRSRSSPLDCLDALLRPEGEAHLRQGEGASGSQWEVETYLRTDVIARSECPLQWWREHGNHYPLLKQVARKFLCSPSTSVPSERLFSAAGNIYTDKRSNLLPERAEMLLFIKYNMKL